MSKTLFEKIIGREIPATIVYEDDLVFALRDINPQAPKHILLVPKKPIPRLAEAGPEDQRVLGHLLLKAAEVADKLGLKESGYRIVINNGSDAGEPCPTCMFTSSAAATWPGRRVNSTETPLHLQDWRIPIPRTAGRCGSAPPDATRPKPAAPCR